MIKLLMLLASNVFALASPVAITSVSRTANVVTVNCATNCNIAPNQGFSVSGVTDTSFNTNGTATTGSGTTFTFSQSGVTASSSGGSVAPAKQVIVLQVTPSPNFIGVQALCWTTTINGIPQSQGSQWIGASNLENNAIKAGTTIEQTLNVQPYPSSYSKAQIQADLQARCNSLQSTLSTGVQPGQFFGGYFDGTAWSF
jgi:hypothetical protein